MNSKIYLFIYIIIFNIIRVYSITKLDILKLNLSVYDSEDKCPEYSLKGSDLDFSCTFTFYCLDNNNCQSDNRDLPFFEFLNENGEVKKIIKNHCTETSLLHGCTTEKCLSDSDCLSNNCFNNTCISGKSLFIECSDINNDINNKNQVQIMKCGKPDGEECEEDLQCAGKCISNSKEKSSICSSHVRLSSTSSISFNYIVILSCILGVILIIGLLYNIWYRHCKKHQSNEYVISK